MKNGRVLKITKAKNHRNECNVKNHLVQLFSSPQIQQHQNNLGTWYKCKFAGTTHDPLNQRIWSLVI